MFSLKKKTWREKTIRNNEKDCPAFKLIAPMAKASKIQTKSLQNQRLIDLKDNSSEQVVAFYIGSLQGELLQSFSTPQNPMPKDILFEALFRFAGYIDMLLEETNSSEEWQNKFEYYRDCYFNHPEFTQLGIQYVLTPEASWENLIRMLDNRLESVE